MHKAEAERQINKRVSTQKSTDFFCNKAKKNGNFTSSCPVYCIELLLENSSLLENVSLPGSDVKTLTPFYHGGRMAALIAGSNGGAPTD